MANTGNKIQPRLIKVSNDGNNYPLDALGRRTDRPPYQPQDSMLNPVDSETYRVDSKDCARPVAYQSVQKSGTATIQCGAGFTGNTVTYTVYAGKHTSMISQEDADQKAQADVDANKQAYANANGVCTPISVYRNVLVTGVAVRQCGANEVGSEVTYTVEAGKYTSTISQADADEKALMDIDENKQAYANQNGTCRVTTIYVWGKIFEEDIETAGSATWATIRLKTYKGGTATTPPADLSQPEPCTNGNIALQYNQADQLGLPNNFTASLNNQQSIQIIPPNTQSSNQKYPKQFIDIGGTGLWVNFTNKAEGEWALLQTKTQ